MVQPITDQAAFLSEASQAAGELIEWKNSLGELRKEEKRLLRELESEKKILSDTINNTVRKRLEEINETYDLEIGRGQERLKKARAKREKAKNQGVKERIEEETSELVSHNQELKSQMKTLFRKEHIPGYCKSAWFYSIYFTRGIREVLILFLTFLVCFLLIPCGIYLLIPDKSPWYLIVVYLVIIIIFGGSYVLISNRTKMRHLASLKQGRVIRDVIKANNKKIRVIINTIKHDHDEAVYNLDKYDDEISQLEQELSGMVAQKREALNTFEKVTRTIIADEIADTGRDKIDQLQSDYGRVSADVRSAEAHIKEKTLYMADHYEAYVGKEFMTPERLDALVDMIKSGKASSISEAESIYLENRLSNERD